MRRFALLFVAALVALTGAAQINTTVKMHRHSSVKSQRAGGVKNCMRHLLVDEKKMAADKAIFEELRANAAKTVKRAGETEDEEPEINYLHNSYIYSDYTGGFHIVNMQPANVEIEGENVSVNLYGNLNPLEGKIQQPSNTDEDGNVFYYITFEDNQLIAEDENKTPYYCRSIDAAYDENTGVYNLSFADAPIEGYYYPDYDELYIAEDAQFGIYAENAAATDPLSLSVFGDIDLLPRETFENAMRKASVYTNSYFESQGERTTDGAAIVTSAGVYINGLSVYGTVWYNLLAYQTESEELQFLVYPQQFATRIKSGDVITQAMDIDTGDEAYFYFKYKEGENNIVLKSDEEDVIYFSEFVVSPEGEGLGSAQLTNDVTITITNEPLAIKGVTDNAGTALSKEYFDLSGRKVGADAKGLVIEKTRYANGKSVSRKVVK